MVVSKACSFSLVGPVGPIDPDGPATAEAGPVGPATTEAGPVGPPRDGEIVPDTERLPVILNCGVDA